MGGPRYDLDEMRERWLEAPECSRAMVFWQTLADACDRPLIGLYKQIAVRSGWAAKVDKLQRCLFCRRRFHWRDFVDGGPIRCCPACAAELVNGSQEVSDE